MPYLGVGTGGGRGVGGEEYYSSLSSLVQHILNLLRHQEVIGNLPVNSNLCLNAVCYRIVIHALARSVNRGADDMAEDIVRSMKRWYEE